MKSDNNKEFEEAHVGVDEDLKNTENSKQPDVVDKDFKRTDTKKLEKRQDKAKRKIGQMSVTEGQAKIPENITPVTKTMSDSEFDKINITLQNHFFFSTLANEERCTIIKHMFYTSTEKDTFVFKQHDKGFCFFIVAEGSVDVVIDGVNKKVLVEYDSFGDLALLYDAPRSASIYSSVKSYFWVIDRKTFKKVYNETVVR